MQFLKLIFPALFILNGCTVIPGTQSSFSDAKNTEPRTYISKLDGKFAAKCVIKNIDERLSYMNGVLSPDAPRPGIIEIRARSEVGFAAIVEISQKEGGSLITTWISNHYLAKETIANWIVEGC